MVSERRESVGLMMAGMVDTIAGRKVDGHRPCPRFIVDEEGWRSISGQLADGYWCLLGLWGDTGAVHMAVLDDTQGRADIAVVSLDCAGGRFPSVGALHPPAIRLERAIHSMFGLEPVGLWDRRPWLDLGFWDIAHPLAAPPPLPSPDGTRACPGSEPYSASRASPTCDGGGIGWGNSAPYEFLPVEGDGLHQIPVGPVHAGIIEPGHFRFTASGETVVRLEERLGYVHKGIEALMAGATLERAARLAGRTSGDSTVAYALAFAHALEAAWEIDVPPRAVYLRALMAEFERLGNHFGDIGAICNDASFSLMHAQCGILRERVLRTADACFGHRLMMDCIVPGGVVHDVSGGFDTTLRSLLDEIERTFPKLIELYDNTASLQDRTATTGILSLELARRFGAGGYVGRASGRAFDARKTVAYPPYDELEFDVPALDDGDVNARVWVRIREVEQSLRLIEQIVRRLPVGSIRQELPPASGTREGLGLVEGFRGDVLVWLRTDDARVSRCHLRDPSWFQWPLLEAVIEGNIVADFPLCNKSFNCSYSGHDL
jgi:Ni,Fe-hydrogenase III large subunit